MTPIQTQDALQKAVQKHLSQSKTIGFVPTMGALHPGHRSLIAYALDQTDVVVVSIFVNPTQFNNAQDLEKYPRDLDADITFLAQFKERLLLYAPSAKEVYQGEIVSKQYRFGKLADVMEGTHRPGHFQGVGTVLSHLFKQVRPHKAFFGEKDFQQLQIVKKLVALEKLDIEIVGCPIHREPSGLAMSSRNERLNEIERIEAAFIYQTLQTAKSLFQSKSARQVKNWVTAVFKNHPSLRLEYFEIANEKELSPLSRKRKNQKYRAFIALYAGDIRLIDTIALY